ncbi:CLUMA_CG003470, isoform A [Clunio marinus]|uniref:Vacuolar ATPase assembly protein VMA22 n=1 Tax=Clunio marinus TaxID=568069 RepID=A0A1J1HUC5_9DIPT|nr:CLUMA_CG003470, isoform A [Clunio marinus]
MELFEDVTELKELMDKLILQTLELVEEDVTLKINIEKLTNEGALLMAKTRYSQGPKTVSVSQLPGESDDGPEFNALKITVRSENDLGTSEFELEKSAVNKESNHIDPINWFGILVPQSLKTARERYEKALELVIESANVEQKLQKNYQLYEKLKSIKVTFENTEE